MEDKPSLTPQQREIQEVNRDETLSMEEKGRRIQNILCRHVSWLQQEDDDDHDDFETTYAAVQMKDGQFHKFVGEDEADHDDDPQTTAALYRRCCHECTCIMLRQYCDGESPFQASAWSVLLDSIAALLNMEREDANEDNPHAASEDASADGDRPFARRVCEALENSTELRDTQHLFASFVNLYRGHNLNDEAMFLLAGILSATERLYRERRHGDAPEILVDLDLDNLDGDEEEEEEEEEESEGEESESEEERRSLAEARRAGDDAREGQGERDGEQGQEREGEAQEHNNPRPRPEGHRQAENREGEDAEEDTEEEDEEEEEEEEEGEALLEDARAHARSAVPVQVVQQLGCPHYIRACKVRCKQCGKFFTCRFCHDEWAATGSSPHEFDRHDVDEMYCMLCGKIGPVGQHCTHCGKQMARYYCPVCHLFEDHPSKAIYHCEKCGICRVGRREDYFHCDNCNMDYPIKTRESHVCHTAEAMRGPCPVCFEEMFISRRAVIPLPCGHCMHEHCNRKLIDTGISTCPVCSRLFIRGAYRQDWEHVHAIMVATTPVPPEFAHMRRTVLCNECGHTFETTINYAGYQCPKCATYNTREK